MVCKLVIRMRSTFFVLSLLLRSVPSHAKSWLCVAEKVAYSSDDGRKITNPYADLKNSQWIVSQNGVREVGSDQPFLTICTTEDDGRPTYCNSPGVYEGHFRMSALVFTLSMTKPLENGGRIILIVKGNCSLVDTE